MKKFCYLLLLAAIYTGNRLSAQQGAKTKATINHLAIYVVNLQKSVAFYSGVFQLDTIPEPFHDNKHAWYSIGTGVSLHIIEGATQPKEYFQNNHICFSVPSVKPFVQKLRENQLPWVDAKGNKGQITTRVDGVQQIWVTDPDGYWIEVNDAKN